MSVLVDANVLLRLAQPASPDHAKAQAAFVQLAGQGIEICLVPQVIYEYWVRDSSGRGQRAGHEHSRSRAFN